MKLSRVIQSEGQNLDPAFTDSLQPSVSRRGFITAAGMGIGLAAMGPSLAVSYTHLTLPTTPYV